MSRVKEELSNYYNEYVKLQHLGTNNQEFRELILNNFNDLIIPNIRAIVELLEDFINEELVKSNYDLTIANWIQHVFNSSIYQLSLKVMKEHLDELTDDDKLLHYYIVKVELLKIKLFKELYKRCNNEIKQNFDDLITVSKNTINTFYEDLIFNHIDFTTSIKLVNEIFSQLGKN